MPDFPIIDKISVIDGLIRTMRPAAASDPAAKRAIEILHAIDADYRAHIKPTTTAFQALDFQVNSARKQKAQLDFIDEGHCRAIAMCVLTHWGVIELALRKHHITEAMITAGAKSLQDTYGVANGTAEHVARKFLTDVLGVEPEFA